MSGGGGGGSRPTCGRRPCLTGAVQDEDQGDQHCTQKDDQRHVAEVHEHQPSGGQAHGSRPPLGLPGRKQGDALGTGLAVGVGRLVGRGRAVGEVRRVAEVVTAGEGVMLRNDAIADGLWDGVTSSMMLGDWSGLPTTPNVPPARRAATATAASDAAATRRGTQTRLTRGLGAARGRRGRAGPVPTSCT